MSLHKGKKFFRTIILILIWLLFAVPALLLVTIKAPITQNYFISIFENWWQDNLHAKFEIGQIKFNTFTNIELLDVYMYDQHDSILFGFPYVKVKIKNIDPFSKPFSMDFKDALLEQPYMNMRTYKGDSLLNINYISQYFSKNKSKEKSTPKITIRNLKIIDGTIKYIDDNFPAYDSTFNYKTMVFEDLNLWITDFKMTDNININVKIHELSTNEKYGMQLKHLDCDFTINNNYFSMNNAHLSTPNSYLNADLIFRYNSFNSFKSFVDSVEMNMYFRPSDLSFVDISFFAPEVRGVYVPIKLYGSLNGYANDLRSDNLKLILGKSSIMDVDFWMKNVVDFPNMQYYLAIQGKNITNEDISAITIKGESILPTNIHLPFISSLSVNASGVGMADVINFEMALDNPDENIFVKINGKNGSYSGQSNFTNFNFAELNIPGNPLQHLDGNIDFDINSLNVNNFNLSTISARANIDINKIIISGIELSQIKGTIDKIDSNYHTEIHSLDPNMRLDLIANAQYGKILSSIILEMNAENVNMNNLHAARNDITSNISAKINANINGNNLNNMLGFVSIKDLHYNEGNKFGSMDSLLLTIQNINDIEKNINIKSDLLDFDLVGQINFATIDEAIKEFINSYFPQLYNDSTSLSIETNQNFNFSLLIKPKIQQFVNIFVKDLSLSEIQTRGSFQSSTNELNFNINIPKFSYSNIAIADSLNLNLETFNNVSYLQLDIKNITSNQINTNKIELLSTINNSKVDFQIKIPNAQVYYPMSTDIQGFIDFKEKNNLSLYFYPSSITIADSVWYILEPSAIIYQGKDINISNFELATNTQSIKVNGKYSKTSEDPLTVVLRNIELSQINNFFSDFQYNIGGYLDGKVELSKFNQKIPNLFANINLNDLSFNGKRIGNIEFTSKWDTIKKGIKTDLVLTDVGAQGIRMPLKANGYIYPTGANNIDLNIDFSNFNLSFIEPIMSEYVSNIGGFAQGNVNVYGSFSAPQMKGEIELIRTRLKINYTNVAYTFTTHVKINPNEIRIDSIVLNDPEANTASGYFVMKYKNFSDFNMDTRLTFNNFLAVDAPPDQNEYFYGKGLVSGAIRLQGPINSLKIDGNVSTESGTRLFIPISSSSVVEQNDFIHFVNPKDTTMDTLQIKPRRELTSDKTTISMNLRVSPSPDTELNIEFDPRIGDKIMVKANGDIQVTMDADGNLNLLGDVIIVDGYYNLTMQNTINKKFNIDPGSVIKWRGNVMNGEMDITARNNIRTSLYSLVGHLDSSEVFKQKYLVSVLLHITGSFMSPEIKFDIELPEADEETKNLVKNVLRTDQDVMQQVFSLLLFNSFISPAGMRGLDIGSGIGNTSFEMLSNQFSNWLSQITGDVNVGFVYSPTETQVSLSTQLLNGKLQISSNIGVNNNNTTANQSSSNFVGDFDLSYRFSDNLKLRLFNKTNPYDQLIYYGPYTQGIGISYNYSFDRIKEMWTNSNNKNAINNKKKKKDKKIDE